MNIDKHKYDDIINLPHHQSKTRNHMSMEDRAAQFSPFAALTGHDDAIEETSRLTDYKMELNEDAKEEVNKNLMYIYENINYEPKAKITYFVPDEMKNGGKYVTVTGIVNKIDKYTRTIIMTDMTEMGIDITEKENMAESGTGIMVEIKENMTETGMIQSDTLEVATRCRREISFDDIVDVACLD